MYKIRIYMNLSDVLINFSLFTGASISLSQAQVWEYKQLIMTYGLSSLVFTLYLTIVWIQPERNKSVLRITTLFIIVLISYTLSCMTFKYHFHLYQMECNLAGDFVHY